jgi:hypothetical protein
MIYTLAKEPVGSIWSLAEFIEMYGDFNIAFDSGTNGRLRYFGIFTDNDNYETIVCLAREVRQHDVGYIIGNRIKYIVKVLDSCLYCICEGDIPVDLEVFTSDVTERKYGFEIYKNGKNSGIITSKGVVVIDAIFSEISFSNKFPNVAIAKKENINLTFAILLETFSDGLICVVECRDNDIQSKYKRQGQYFIDRFGHKQIIFSERWAHENKVPFSNIYIPLDFHNKFIDGFIEIEIPVDENYGYIFKVDKSGRTYYYKDVGYREPVNFSPEEVLDYGDYDGYWSISDENYRDALDDDAEAFINMD